MTEQQRYECSVCCYASTSESKLEAHVAKEHTRRTGENESEEAMSYYEIDVVVRYALRCTTKGCGFNKVVVASAGRAEETAKEHIEEWTNKNAYSNFAHVVEISEVTLVGRDV